MIVRKLRGISAVAVGLAALSLPVLDPPTAVAKPDAPIFCSAEGQLLPSAPEVGYVYAQSGARCAKSVDTETRIEAQAFRDGVLVDSATGSCPRGHFREQQRCTIRQMALTNPGGQQDFKVVITVQFTVNKSEPSRSATVSTVGRY